MDPFGGNPQPPIDQPLPQLDEPGLDDPPRMDAGEAFAVGRAIGNGYGALKRAPLAMLLAGFLMALFDGSNSGNFGRGFGDSSSNRHRRNDWSQLEESVGRPVRLAVTERLGVNPFRPMAALLQRGEDIAALAAVTLGALVCIGILLIGFLVARSFLKPGVIRLHSHLLQTASPDSVGVIFSGSDRFVDMLLWELLSGLVFMAAALVAFIPAGILFGVAIAAHTPEMVWVGFLLAVVVGLPLMIYVGLGLSLGAHVVTLEKRGAVDSLKRSWRLASGNRIQLFVFFLVVGLVQLAAVLAGMLLCCVGLIVTIPAGRSITDFATTESFLLLTRGHDVTGYWQLWQLQAAGAI